MTEKLYACCSDPSCPYCGGSGIVYGQEADAFYAWLEEYAKLKAREEGNHGQNHE